MSSRLVGIYIGSEKGAGKASLSSVELVADHGLRGDRHAGRDPHRQVSLFAEEVRREMIDRGFEVPPESLSANLLTENLPLDELKPGRRLRIGEAEVEITESRQPCRSITRIDHRLPKLLIGRCGQFARVVKGGLIHCGDELEPL